MTAAQPPPATVDAWTATRHDARQRNLPAGVGLAAICVACAAPNAPRPLACRPLSYLGRLSYGIYLWHYPILLGLQVRGLLAGA